MCVEYAYIGVVVAELSTFLDSTCLRGSVCVTYEKLAGEDRCPLDAVSSCSKIRLTFRILFWSRAWGKEEILMKFLIRELGTEMSTCSTQDTMRREFSILDHESSNVTTCAA